MQSKTYEWETDLQLGTQSAQAMGHTPSRVVIVNDASVARGGATGLSLVLARQLRARGIDVAFVCGDRGENPELAELGITVVALGGTKLTSAGPSAALTGIYNHGAKRILQRFIDETDTPDTVYHVHGWAQILSPSIFSALQDVAPRTIIHAHDYFLACPNGAFTNYHERKPCSLRPLSGTCIATNCDKRNYPQKLWRVARQASLRRNFPSTADWFGIAMIHPSMAPYLRRGGYPENMLRVVRNPVTPFTSERVPAEDNRNFVFIGRIEEDKGTFEMARAARMAEVPLTIIGEGNLREKLAAEYPEITFTGWQNREQIAETIRTARAVIVPSISPEPFGLVIAESSLSGLPVIISDTALLAPEIAQNGLGLSASIRDSAALAAALSEIKGMPREAIREISEAAFSGRAGIAHTSEKWTEMLVALYSEALAS